MTHRRPGTDIAESSHVHEDFQQHVLHVFTTQQKQSCDQLPNASPHTGLNCLPTQGVKKGVVYSPKKKADIQNQYVLPSVIFFPFSPALGCITGKQ